MASRVLAAHALPRRPGHSPYVFMYFRRRALLSHCSTRPPQAGKWEKHLSAISEKFESEKRVLTGHIARLETSALYSAT